MRVTTAPGSLAALSQVGSPTTAPPSLPSRGSLDVSTIRGRRFVIPDSAPSKENWVPDEQALECMICSEAFSMVSMARYYGNEKQA